MKRIIIPKLNPVTAQKFDKQWIFNQTIKFISSTPFWFIVLIFIAHSVTAQSFIKKNNDNHSDKYSVSNSISGTAEGSFIQHVMTKEQLGANMLKVAFGGGVFVAVGDSSSNGKIFKSFDGINWTIGNGLPHINFEGVKYFDGYFYAYGKWRKVDEQYLPYYSTIWKSVDGTNWAVVWSQIVDGNPQYGVQDIAYGNEKFVIAINDRLFVSENNLVSLTQTTAVNGTGLQDQFGLRKVGFGNGIFVAVNDLERSWAVNMAYSTDGTNWITLSGEPIADCIAFVNNHFVAASSYRIKISSNGVDWTQTPQGKGTSIAYANGTYIIPHAISGHPNTDLRYSTELQSNISKIYQRNLGFDEWSDLRSVAAGNNGFVVVGGAGILFTSFSDFENYPKISTPDIIEMEKGKTFEYNVEAIGFEPDFIRINLDQGVGITLPPGMKQAQFSYGININQKTPHFSGTPTEVGEWPVILYVYEDGLGDQDLYVKKKVIFKVNLPTDISNENLIVEDFKLMQNFPNPFNPSTKIDYQIKSPTHVKIKIFDIAGSEVTTLVNEFNNAGNYSVEFNAGSEKLSSGIYFYTMQAGDNLITRKMTLLK